MDNSKLYNLFDVGAGLHGTSTYAPTRLKKRQRQSLSLNACYDTIAGMYGDAVVQKASPVQSISGIARH